MNTKETYEKAIEQIRKINPDLFNSEDELLKKFKMMEEDAAKEDDPLAKNIYLQARNFFAVALGKDMIAEEEENVMKMFEKEIEVKKVIAIKVDGENFGTSMFKILEKIADFEFKIFQNFKDLLKDIIAGKICGVIAVKGMDNVFTEGVLRHDLKNMSGFDVKKADEFPMPPIVEVKFPTMLADIMKAAKDILSGKVFEKVVSDEVILEDALPELRNLMLVQNKEVVVSIVDDMEAEVAAMVKILEVFPNVRMENIIGSVKSAFQVADAIMNINPDIVLLDEAIDEVRGTQVAAELDKAGFAGVKASITGGSKPDFAKFHFQQKVLMRGDKEECENFVKFVNIVISSL